MPPKSKKPTSKAKKASKKAIVKSRAKAARNSKPKAKRRSAPARAPRRAAPVRNAAAPAPQPDLRSEFLRLVSKLGSAEAQRLLDTFVEVETPRSS